MLLFFSNYSNKVQEGWLGNDHSPTTSRPWAITGSSNEMSLTSDTPEHDALKKVRG